MVVIALGATVGYAQSLTNTKTLHAGAFTQNILKTSVLSGEHSTSGDDDDDEHPECDDDDDDDENRHLTSGKTDDDDDDDDDDDNCVPPSVITSADVDFELENVLRAGPNGQFWNAQTNSLDRDDYFANMITACSFHSDEDIPGPATIICKLTDNRNDVTNPDGSVTQHFGGVIAEGSLPLPNGYKASTREIIPITQTTFRDANEVQNVHDVKIIVMGPVPPAQPPEGCSPGFWKNPSRWTLTGFKTGDKFFDVFHRTVTLKVDNKQVTNPTLLQAIKAQGGGINALARQSVAALLNAAHPTVDPEPAFDTTKEVIKAFQAAFDSGIFNPTKDLLETSNHRGSEICPEDGTSS